MALENVLGGVLGSRGELDDASLLVGKSSDDPGLDVMAEARSSLLHRDTHSSREALNHRWWRRGATMNVRDEVLEQSRWIIVGTYSRAWQ